MFLVLSSVCATNGRATTALKRSHYVSLLDHWQSLKKTLTIPTVRGGCLKVQISLTPSVPHTEELMGLFVQTHGLGVEWHTGYSC